MKKNSFGMHCNTKNGNNFGRSRGFLNFGRCSNCNCPGCCGNCSGAISYASNFGTNCHPEHRNNFGSKGDSGLTVSQLKDFLSVNKIDIPMSAKKSQLLSMVRSNYPGITPSEIKQKLNISAEQFKINKEIDKKEKKLAQERIRLLEQQTRINELREYARRLSDEPRFVPVEARVLTARRLPAGSKIVRGPKVNKESIDDLADMFSAARAGPDSTSDLFSKLNLSKFGR